MIKSTSYSNDEILKNIISLHCPEGIDLDPTYSKGVFYKNMDFQPRLKFDLYPQIDGVQKADACELPLESNSLKSICFDPPFIAGHTKPKVTGIIGERFHGFRYVSDLWAWYDKCLQEFSRLLQTDGVLIFKCQDTVSSGKQHWSHVFIMNEAAKHGFYCKDLFILLAKSRIVGHNHKIQKHARKFHSYFLVFTKKAPTVPRTISPESPIQDETKV